MEIQPARLDHEAEWWTCAARVDPRLEADGWKVVDFDPQRPLRDLPTPG